MDRDAQQKNFQDLKEFYMDRDAQQKNFQDLKARAKNDTTDTHLSLSMDAFDEDWNSSQFWYSQDTAAILANQLLAKVDSKTNIAVVSAPSVFVQLKNILAEKGTPIEEQPKIWLLEYDERFNVFPEFVCYDFHKPFSLPSSLRASIDRIICDPPFLSDDCQTKAAMTVRWLSRTWSETPAPKTIICTGERMEALVNRLYRPQGIATTTFNPLHAKGLSNEFRCYANFEGDAWQWKT